jgi:hypothetical protein
MITIDIDDEMDERARTLAERFKTVQNMDASIEHGNGNYIGFLGELAFARAWENAGKYVYHDDAIERRSHDGYDCLIQINGEKRSVDVKTTMPYGKRLLIQKEKFDSGIACDFYVAARWHHNHIAIYGFLPKEVVPDMKVSAIQRVNYWRYIKSLKKIEKLLEVSE